MDNKKKFIITSITLGLIAMTSAVLIGLTNLVTKDRIAQNEKNQINNGITEIFGKNSSISAEYDLDGAGLSLDYKYVNYLYDVKDENENIVGVAFKTTGSNMYGKISLLVGYTKENLLFSGVSIIVNEQTYATTLVDNYINPLNEGERDLNDVSCGATYGATLVREMVNEAKEAAKEYWKVV